jgi:nitroreductase
MNYEAVVRQQRRHSDLAHAKTDHRELVRYATLAASSHNTQPWTFRVQPGRIVIQPDLRRRCPAVDPDDHHLYASLGCAAENLLLAAEAAGLRGHLEYDANATRLDIDLEDAPLARSPLFEAIPERQGSRVPYDGRPLGVDELATLDAAGRGDGVDLILITDEQRREAVAEFVMAGNTVQFADRAWAEELRAWIRFSAAEAVRTGDGLWGPVMGSPSVPRWLGEIFMRVGFSATRQNATDLRNIRSAGAIAVFVSAKNDPKHWVEAGRCYQRFALQATALGLRTAFINQPVEVAALRPQFAAWLGIGERRPDLIVRVGRGPQAPQSLRRPLEQVVA